MLLSPAIEVVVSCPPPEPSVIDGDSVLVEYSAVAFEVVESVPRVVLSAAQALRASRMAVADTLRCIQSRMVLPGQPLDSVRNNLNNGFIPLIV